MECAHWLSGAGSQRQTSPPRFLEVNTATLPRGRSLRENADLGSHSPPTRRLQRRNGDARPPAIGRDRADQPVQHGPLAGFPYLPGRAQRHARSEPPAHHRLHHADLAGVAGGVRSCRTMACRSSVQSIARTSCRMRAVTRAGSRDTSTPEGRRRSKRSRRDNSSHDLALRRSWPRFDGRPIGTSCLISAGPD